MDKIKIAVIQFAAGKETGKPFEERAVALVAQAAAQKADLVLLPALTGWMFPWSLSFRVFFADLARQHGIFLAPGTVRAPGQEGYLHTAYLFGPDGSVLLEQAQTHTTLRERRGGMLAGETLQPVQTEIGSIGFVIGTDAWYPEASRILALQGAEILLSPQAMEAPYGKWHQIRGLWQEVQQNQVYGIECGLVGAWEGARYQGRSAIFAPCEITEGLTGFLAHVGPVVAGETEVAPEQTAGAYLEQEILLSAQVSLADLRLARERFPIYRHFNCALYERAIPKIYESQAEANQKWDPPGRQPTG